MVLLIASSSLLLEVGCLENLRLFEHLGLNRVRIQLNVQAPLLDLLALCDHLIQLLDRVNPVVRLLEEALAHLRNGLFVFPHLLRNSNEHSKFWR